MRVQPRALPRRRAQARVPRRPQPKRKRRASSAVLHSRAEAAEAFKALDDATSPPYIFLSAAVDMTVFVAALAFARAAVSRYRGVLCGRATWKGAIPVYAPQGAEAARAWLAGEGAANIRALNAVLER